MVFQRSMLNWRRGWGQSAMGNGFPEIYAQLDEGGWGQSAMVYVHSAIYDSYLV